MMCKAMEEMVNQAREEGMSLLAALIDKLTESGRTEEVAKVIRDADYREQMLEEVLGQGWNG